MANGLTFWRKSNGASTYVGAPVVDAEQGTDKPGNVCRFGNGDTMLILHRKDYPVLFAWLDAQGTAAALGNKAVAGPRYKPSTK